MIKIEYPEYQPKIKNQQDKEFIFDEIRRQWIMLTPEEWVRQNFLQYLVLIKKYPSSLIAVEKEIQLGDLTKRFDIVVYDRNARPWMIIECKEMSVALTAPVLNQALRYNITLNVPYIVITNGSHCYGFSGSNGKLDELDSLPDYGA
ncbi:MAG: type I restriction enzyme HsdR N-terminal domain-containing protein [Ferruginibacter sp.]